jgi:cytochrome c oxidase subunit II
VNEGVLEMRRRSGSWRRPSVVATAPVLALLTGCELPRALDPRGPAAAEIADIWWILFWTATVVSLVVFALLAVAIIRARRYARALDRHRHGQLGADDPDALTDPARAGLETPRASWLEGRTTGFVLIGGGVIPILILIGATFLTLSGLSVFDAPPEGVDTTVTVTGHMFWWEIDYPDDGVTTANELHIPVGQSVRVELESADVIHSFWVPQLHGKLEMIPGKTNTIYLQADEPGTYFGKCAEFCGPQHANMEFLVIAQPQAEFDAWLEAQAADAREPEGEMAERGREVFTQNQCALCHTIRGVSRAAVEVGPDLTHLASRRTLAARTLDNVRGNLGGWILDPQGIKPGSQMPAVNLPSEDFLALLDYLEGLR